MKVTKIGHCCLFIETEKVNILTDPGKFTVEQNDIKNIDIILITHEHSDHLHTESLQTILANNPKAEVITNSSVGEILTDENIRFTKVADGESNDEHGILIEGYGTEHAEIFKDFGLVENTGYFIGGRMFYPGDAYTDPGKPVPILAVPIAGPWMALSEAINYANKIKPTICFPVHDGVLSDFGVEVHHGVFARNIDKGIAFVPLQAGGETTFADIS